MDRTRASSPGRAATTGNPPRTFPEGGYIDAIPTDPWGRDYDYVCEPFAGVRIPYELQSLGADGSEVAR